MYAVIDSGTTRTRVRVWAGGQVVWQGERSVGARVTAAQGPGPLRGALAELLGEARAQGAPQAVLASGMIGSNVGLAEIPHVAAPVSFGELARHIRTLDLRELGAVSFVPGVKTVVTGGLAAIGGLDVMRGEEVEVCALRGLLGLRGPVAFVHYGSHHKVVHTDAEGILRSATTLGGELLAAALQHTILASSTLPLAELGEPQQEAWLAGLHEARALGFARAAFSVRLGEQLLGLDRAQATSFLLGAVASQDLALLPEGMPLALYGHATFTAPMSAYLRGQGREVQVATPEQSALAATLGTVQLYERSQHA